MTEESANRVLRKLDAILEAADEIHPMDIGENIKRNTLWGWARELRDRIYDRVGEIESEVRECEEIVRCKDCIRSKPSECWEGLYNCEFIQVSMPPDGFCAWGERREA